MSWPWSMPSAIFNGYVQVYKKVETMNDYVTQNWRAIRNAGGIINNPLNHSIEEWWREPCVYTDYAATFGLANCSGVSTKISDGTPVRYFGTRAMQDVCGNTYPSTPSLDVGSLSAQAVSKANANIGFNEMQALPALAESEKTIHSITQLTRRVYRFTKALVRFDVGRVMAEFSPKQLADRWMEARYAIRPLIYDMRDAVAAAAAAKRTNIRRTFKGVKTGSGVSEEVVKTFSNSRFDVYAKRRVERTVSASAGVLTATQQVSNSMIWGLDRPIEAIWELVPYSFVVDWFLNVGTTLASWTPKFGIKTLASWVTVKDSVMKTARIDHLVDNYNPSNLFGKDFVVSGGRHDTRLTSVLRVVDPTLPLLPTFELRLDAAKLLDLAIMTRRLISRYRG